MKKFNDYIIYEDNLINNAKVLRKRVGKKVKICAMVKANAYGHGIKSVCKILKPYIDFFGVATACEAREIRVFDKDTPILVVGLTDPKNYKWCAKNSVSVTINSMEEVLYINKRELELAGLKVHFKINTGLNRVGFSFVSDFVDAFNILKENKKIIIEGVFTHFATKGNDVDFIDYQYNIFSNFIKKINRKDIIIHCCNSYATSNKKQYHNDMVRCGFNLFGWNENDEYKPVSQIKAKLLGVHNVFDGETIGYDRTFKTDANMQVGVVSMGYADGFDRRLSNKAHVIVNGQYCKVVGLICMDVFMVDLGSSGIHKVGDEVVILGSSGDLSITPQYYAKILETSPYEVFLKYNHRRVNYIVK